MLNYIFKNKFKITKTMKYKRIKMKTIKKQAIRYYLPSMLSSGCSKLAPKCQRNPNRRVVLSPFRFNALPFYRPPAVWSLSKMRSRGLSFLFSFSSTKRICDISHMRNIGYAIYRICEISHMRFETDMRHIAYAICSN